MRKEILKLCERLTISEIDDLKYELSLLRQEKFNSLYKTIEIYPGIRIEEKIKKETGFHCYHKPCEGYSSGRSTHIIVIPINKYSKELKEKLISKYEDPVFIKKLN